MVEKCNICPHNCGVNRKEKLGFCNIGKNLQISNVQTHLWEEPCISGTNGTCAIFFTGCNLRCVYCQNYEISRNNSTGKEITVEELADLILKKESEGVNNIDLVSPTPYIPMIRESLVLAKSKGLKIPIVYNSNGYENIEALKSLEGLIDIYLPDFKYGFNELAKKYSKVDKYVETAISAIKEMNRQVGSPMFNSNGIIQKGLIIRHLVLPNMIENSKKVLDIIKENVGKEAYISVMGQYVPVADACEFNEINRKISEEEYNEIIDYFFDIGLKNGFMQELDSACEDYIPKW